LVFTMNTNRPLRIIAERYDLKCHLYNTEIAAYLYDRGNGLHLSFSLNNLEYFIADIWLWKYLLLHLISQNKF